jgi:hypothetical protein
VPAGPRARAAVAESAILAHAPWIRQSGAGAPLFQETPPVSSLTYPAGTTYAEALDRLLRSVVEHGALPEGTSLGPPLTGGVVWSGSPADRPSLDLRAPWGYAVPAGRIRAPSFTLPARLSAAEAKAALGAFAGGRAIDRPLPPGTQVNAPALPTCQVASPGRRHSPCALTRRTTTR